MIKVTTPSRICLFGEHQDYLGLPVLAMAISLRSEIKFLKRSDRIVKIKMPDIKDEQIFDLDNLRYEHNRDYYKSGVKVCMESGMQFSQGFECEIRSDIPIQSGLSSSSSIVVGWINFLSKICDQKKEISNYQIAELAYRAEVLEFNEPGGMMDQFSTSYGGLIGIDTSSKNVEQFNLDLGTIIIGDSNERKNTLSILERCKKERLSIIDRIKKIDPAFNLRISVFDDISCDLSDSEAQLIQATLDNRDIYNQAEIEIRKKVVDLKKIGKLLIKHHENLSKGLRVSTAKIDNMLNASMEAGALGGKITGSGGGGCMFVLSTEDPLKIVSAIKKNGGKAHIVKMDTGTYLA